MNPNFNKGNGLLPVIIQDKTTLQVLMLGYMNEQALEQTRTSRLVTFFSRRKDRLWVKGETSGNYLHVSDIHLDCDNDTLLILAMPSGNVCHTGSKSCFGVKSSKGFLYELEQIIKSRISKDSKDSYTAKLFSAGINKIAQKVGEEAVEVVIEAKDDNIELFKNEAADLLYHLSLLFAKKGVCFEDIEAVLDKRNSTEQTD